MTALLKAARNTFHKALILGETLTFSNFNKHGASKIASNADSGQKLSVQVSNLLAEKIAAGVDLSIIFRKKKQGQTLGNEFEQYCAKFVDLTFCQLPHLRPGNWIVEKISGRKESILGNYEQYQHLTELGKLANEHAELRSFLGQGYTVSPDIIVARLPESDENINKIQQIVDDQTAQKTMLRQSNHQNPKYPTPLLHASISCKFTMRSDRAQNTRTEALNLIRGRKGRTPHIISVTAEPMPSRIASLALGTGDLDCVYHFALYELKETLEELQKEDALELLNMMVTGKRLKDISDIPLDLAI